MNIKNSFISALKALKRNKMRSALTSVGIIIGVSSVIMMIGLGSSAKVEVRKKIFTFGANAMSVYDSVKPLRIRDVDGLKRSFSQIRYITPVIYDTYVMIKFGNRNLFSRYYGVNNDFFRIKEWELQSGNYFTDYQVKNNDKVVVIGSTVKRELFGGVDPVGKFISINKMPFKVVGVLVETGSSFSGRDYDNVLVLPYTTVATRLKATESFDEIYVSTYSELMLDETEQALKSYFRNIHNIKPNEINDFKIQSSKEKLKTADMISDILSYLLAGIASISLFVGGVGIMNIMLVSVSERTREIGIRMAIGAKKKDILIQFLIESVTLSGVGGVIGILLGLLLYLIIVKVAGWVFIFSMFSIFISFFFSCSVGIFFGYYPARKAAALKPIDALRFE